MILLINLLISLSGILFLSLLCVFFVNLKNKLLSMIERHLLFKRTIYVEQIFNDKKEQAYQKIFRDNILTQSVSGIKINQIEMTKLQEEFIRMTLFICGSSITDDLEKIFGDYESICSTLATEFAIKLGDDERTILESLKQNESLGDF